MIPAFLTTFLWSLSVVCARRAQGFVGSVRANLGRLTLATVLLGLWAHVLGGGLRGDSLGWFVLSGIVGLGIGDIAAYEALPRLGSRLTALITQCLAAVFAALVEWLWLGTTLSGAQIAWAAVILIGVSVAIAPSEHLGLERGRLTVGTIFGVLAGLGQGGGAVLSRKAYLTAALAHQHVDGGTAAYQRMVGGLGLVLAFFLLVSIRHGTDDGRSRGWRRAGPWIVAHTLTGPVVGVSCYQWALGTTPSGIVLPIVATTPLAVIPLACVLEGDRPGTRALAGGVLAVAGAVALALVR